MLVIGVDPDTHGCFWVFYGGERLGSDDYGQMKGDLTRQAAYWQDLFKKLLLKKPILAIEDQYLHPRTPNFRAIKSLILARGICEGAYRAVFHRDPIIVHPKTWQKAVGCRTTAKRDECEAVAQGYAETVAGINLPSQHLREAFCIAATTLDRFRCGDLAKSEHP